MSDMKCPICGQELKNINFMWFCENESCKAYDWTMEESAWQELIRTRNALDVAVDALKRIESTKWCDSMSSYEEMTFRANKALDQITALEQKEEK